ncbi:phage tail protein [Vibrio diabolicus]|uniref:phage tail protein n=1 Tax=Vibrio diabolicus TaxID=50719 RepID=UPI0024944BFC|nr:phage tail protein [Vibrio diabolicus]
MAFGDFRKWLSGQLTKARQKETAWVDLASAIADSIETHVDSYIEKLKARSSLYEMDKESLLEDIRELRKIFPLGEVADEDLPHVVMQRKDEIHFKKTIYPLISTLAREFKGLRVKWEQIYAPVDQERFPYGTFLVPESELELQSDFFLTSRGAIRIPLNDIAGEDGITEEAIRAFEAKIRRVVHPLIPLRIVLDGQLYSIEFEVMDMVEIPHYFDHVTVGKQVTTDIESTPSYKQDFVRTGTTTQEERPVSPMYGTARMDAIPLDAISIDRRYY